MRVTIFDYGAGNLHSLAKAIESRDRQVILETDPARAVRCDALVLPGVGAFPAAAARLAPGRDVMRDAIVGGLPTVGICLGMQLLFDASEEGPGAGLGIIPGTVTRLLARRVPQIGWNAVEETSDPAFASCGLEMAYFANGFVCRPADTSCVVAWSTHEDDRFPAAVSAGRAVGMQFHPEKSSEPGVRLLRHVLDEVAR